jgi:hypothetical protein
VELLADEGSHRAVEHPDGEAHIEVEERRQQRSKVPRATKIPDPSADAAHGSSPYSTEYFHYTARHGARQLPGMNGKSPISTPLAMTHFRNRTAMIPSLKVGVPNQGFGVAPKGGSTDWRVTVRSVVTTRAVQPRRGFLRKSAAEGQLGGRAAPGADRPTRHIGSSAWGKVVGAEVDFIETSGWTAGGGASGRKVFFMIKGRYTLVGLISEYVEKAVNRLLGWDLRRPLRREQPRAAETGRSVPAKQPWTPAHADERTMRRIAEAQHGGESSQQSAARYARGENPGGTHHKAVRHDGPAHQRPALYEPQERKETVPGGEKHIAVMRRGA